MTSGREYRKPLPADCMLGNEIHPSILDRLNRIRELPVVSAATLIGTQRDETRTDLVWRWIDGKTLGAALSTPIDSRTQFDWARQLQQCVLSIHWQGIVHGNIHAENIIIDAKDRLHLTHFSPLLHDDFAVDQDAVRSLCSKLGVPYHAEGSAVDTLDQSRELARYYRAAGGITALCCVVIYLLLMWYSRN